MSHQSYGLGRGETRIFQPHDLAFEGEQQHPRPDVLYHLERELERKHTIPVPRSGWMNAIRSGDMLVR
jgi:hypothetical protein